MCKVYLRVPSVRVADRLANPQGEQGLVAGVSQRVDGLGEHAGWSSVDPRQEFEEEVQPIAADKYEKVKVHEQAVWNWPVLMFKIWYRRVDVATKKSSGDQASWNKAFSAEGCKQKAK